MNLRCRSLRLLATALVLVAAAACAPFGGGAAPAGNNGLEHAIAADLFARLNQERAARGLAPLVYDFGLEAHARDWSGAMASRVGFRHSDLQPLLGPYTAAAENIAWTRGGSSGLVGLRWMQSDGHRHNMLAPNLDVVGIGVYCAPGHEMWVTEQFGRGPTSGNPWGFGGMPAPAPVARPDTRGPTC